MFLEIFLSLFLFLVLYQVVIFMIMPYVIALMIPRRGRRRAIDTMASIARMPGIGGDHGKAIVFFAIGHQCFLDKRYDEAAGWYERLMGVKKVPELYVPVMHGRYADCCELLGRTEQAEQHRKLALITAQQTPTKIDSVIETGEQLQILGQLDRALQVYESAIRTVKFASFQRNQLRYNVATLAHRIGRPDIVVNTVNAALNDRILRSYLMFMMQLLGLAYLDQGNLNKAAEAIQKFSEAAKSSGNSQATAAALADYALICRARGNLAEAVASAVQALAASTPPSSKCAMVLCQNFMLVGRYPDALEAIDGPKLDQHNLPYQIRINKSGVLGTKARLLNEMGRADEAEIQLKEALANVQNTDPRAKLLALFGAVLAAQAGRFNEARSMIPVIEGILSDTRLGRHVRLDFLADLIRLSCLLGDHDACLRYLLQFRALNPYIVEMPRPLFFTASACLKYGDRARAIELYTEASTVCPEAVYAIHAKNQLGSLV
jgi:tetratricopeptide (TPR) repeat protein